MVAPAAMASRRDFLKKCLKAYWQRYYSLHRSRDALSPVCGIFKASTLWANAFYKSKCPSVCPSLCVSVCSIFKVPFKRLFAPTSRSPVSKNFRDAESLGKVVERRFSDLSIFAQKWYKIATVKKSFLQIFLKIFQF